MICWVRGLVNKSFNTSLTTIAGSQSHYADSGVILLTPRSWESAAADCAALGERLWGPELKTSSIQSNLDYLTYEGIYRASQQYWISSDRFGARVINEAGCIEPAQHHLDLPALCTQSAPFSNSTYQDTSSKWQITVRSNNEYLTGYVQYGIFHCSLS
jgi:hypothetical protein